MSKRNSALPTQQSAVLILPILSTSIFDGVELQRRRREEGGALLPKNLPEPANFWAEITTALEAAEYQRIVETHKVKKPELPVSNDE